MGKHLIRPIEPPSFFKKRKKAVHGSRKKQVMKKVRELIAEFIGTFALILVGAGSVVLNAGLIGIALAHGLVIFTMASAFGNVSGGHFNPAVSLGVRLMGKISRIQLAKYVGA